MTTPKVYTKTGDQGVASLYSSERRSKADSCFQALGDVDEANAHLGLARSYCGGDEMLISQLAEIQSRLFDLGAQLATPRTSSNTSKLQRTEFHDEHVTTLETWIDSMDGQLSPLRNFILPGGGNPGSATLHVARAVVRRAERSVVPLLEAGDVDAVVLRYLNRLSDYLFVAARYAAHRQQEVETIWKKARSC
jgi:cob(I)alamin adenosyltransferase